jgi:hypothetical protein
MQYWLISTLAQSEFQQTIKFDLELFSGAFEIIFARRKFSLIFPGNGTMRRHNPFKSIETS